MNRTFLLVLLALVVLTPAAPIPASAMATNPEPRLAGQATWLEPNGLSIVDLVGYVPEADLKDAILSNATGIGIVQYDSGTRAGNTVTIHARIYPRMYVNGGVAQSFFNCLGQQAIYDNWGTVVPASKMRVWDGSTDLTSKLHFSEGGSYAVGGQNQPIHDAQYGLSRYAYSMAPLSFSGGWAQLPANRGCQLYVPGLYSALTADFVFDAAPQVRVQVAGHDTFNYHSYIGVGNVGRLSGLMQQMNGKYGGRHDKFNFTPPAGANYMFVKFAPMLADAYTNQYDPNDDPSRNAGGRSSGTYRLQGSKLSVDHVVSMGLPFSGQWIDADLSGGSTWLPYTANPRVLAAPEYVLMPGIPYNACMTAGNCPDSLLQQNHDATSPMQVTYLAVTRTDPTLTRVPLRMVGPSWQPGAAVQSAGGGVAAVAAAPNPLLDKHFYLPITARQKPPVPPDDATGCPCGWFSADGRMLGFIPAP